MELIYLRGTLPLSHSLLPKSFTYVKATPIPPSGVGLRTRVLPGSGAQNPRVSRRILPLCVFALARTFLRDGRSQKKC